MSNLPDGRNYTRASYLRFKDNFLAFFDAVVNQVNANQGYDCTPKYINGQFLIKHHGSHQHGYQRIDICIQ